MYKKLILGSVLAGAGYMFSNVLGKKRINNILNTHKNCEQYMNDFANAMDREIYMDHFEKKYKWVESTIEKHVGENIKPLFTDGLSTHVYYDTINSQKFVFIPLTSFLSDVIVTNTPVSWKIFQTHLYHEIGHLTDKEFLEYSKYSQKFAIPLVLFCTPFIISSPVLLIPYITICLAGIYTKKRLEKNADLIGLKLFKSDFNNTDDYIESFEYFKEYEIKHRDNSPFYSKFLRSKNGDNYSDIAHPLLNTRIAYLKEYAKTI